MVDPGSAYHLSYEVEIHAAETYGKYLALNGPDDKILEILNDELEHSREPLKAIELINSDRFTNDLPSCEELIHDTQNG